MSPTNICPRCGRTSPAGNTFCVNCGATLSSHTSAKGWKLLLGAVALFAGLLWTAAIFTQMSRPTGVTQPQTLTGNVASTPPQQTAQPTPQPLARRDKKSNENANANAPSENSSSASSKAASSSSSGSTSSSGQGTPKTSPLEDSSDEYYTNSKGVRVHRPERSENGPPEGATAQCADGTYSFSQSRRGTCSHHGGVSRWL